MILRRHSVIRLLRLPPGRWWLLFEAMLCLLGARLAVLLVPFSRMRQHLGELKPPAEENTSAEEAIVQVARDVRWAVNAVANRSPLEMVCLPRALAAWHMLRRRGIASRLHFGAPRQPEPGRAGLQTHAWLTSSGVKVTGYPVAYGCVEIGFFSRTGEGATEHNEAAVAMR